MNGRIIGVDNLPSGTKTGGVWRMRDQAIHKRAGRWPAVYTFTTYPDTTLDPNKKGDGVTLSNGNLTASIAGLSSVLGTRFISAGDWFFEITVDSGATNAMCGIGNPSTTLSSYPGANSSSRGYYYNGNKYPGASPYGASYTNGDIIGVFIDKDAGTVEFYKNGVSQGIAFSDLGSMGDASIAIGHAASSGTTVFTRQFRRDPLRLPAWIRTPPCSTPANESERPRPRS
jgi:hypothetical protein